MFGIFEKTDVERTVELLEMRDYSMKENKRKSIYNTSDTVIFRKYRNNNRIVSFMFSKEIMVDLIILINNEEIIIKHCVKDFNEVCDFINANDEEIEIVLREVMEKKADTMFQFLSETTTVTDKDNEKKIKHREAQKRYNEKTGYSKSDKSKNITKEWKKKNIKSFSFSFNINTDNEILDKIKNSGNAGSYIKSLILADIEREG